MDSKIFFMVFLIFFQVHNSLISLYIIDEPCPFLHLSIGLVAVEIGSVCLSLFNRGRPSQTSKELGQFYTPMDNGQHIKEYNNLVYPMDNGQTKENKEVSVWIIVKSTVRRDIRKEKRAVERVIVE